MVKRIEADGDTWEAALASDRTTTGAAALVFHCVSNSQRPYRVVPVPPAGGAGAPASDGGVAGASRLDARDLRDLFDRSQVMDFVRDPEADPRNPRPRTTP